MEEKEITLEIRRPEVFVLLTILIVVFVLEFRVSSSSPIVFGDEGLHTRLAQWIAQEKEYPVWYPFLGTNVDRGGFTRPPLWNTLEASFLYVFGFREGIIKFLTPFIASILMGLAVYLLTKRVLNKGAAFAAAIIAVTIPSIATYSVLFYTDVLFTFYFFMFALMLVLAIQTDSKKYWVISGVFGAFAFLSKTVGYSALILVGIYFLHSIYKQRKLDIKILKNYAILVLVFVLISSTYFIRSYAYYGTPSCDVSLPFFTHDECALKDLEYKESGKYSYAGRTEMVGTETSVWKLGITNYIQFAYGNLWFVFLSFLGGLIILSYRREMVDELMLLIMALFLLLFYISTPRAEDTARYTLGWVPIIALISGVYFGEVYNFLKKYNKYLALVVFIIVIYYGFQNLQDKLSVMSQVKQFSPSFFDACNWVKQNLPKDALITTAWPFHTLYNCQRNVGGGGPDIVLSGDLDLALSTLKKQGVTHIFIQKWAISTQDLTERYPLKFVQFLENNPDHFKKVYENGEPNIEICAYRGCDGAIIYEVIY